MHLALQNAETISRLVETGIWDGAYTDHVNRGR